MRILYAMPGYKPAYRIGGPVVSVSATAERLVRRGHHVTVVTTNANLDQDIDVPLGRAVDVEGVEVWYFQHHEPLKKWLPFVPYLSKSLGFLYSPELKRALDVMVPTVDVVDTQMPFVYPTYAASRVALSFGKPLFYHQRGNFLDSHLGRRKRKKQLYTALFERPVMRRATALIALTDAEREAFRAIAPDTPCEVIPNGVEVPDMSTSMGAAERIEIRYGIPRDAMVILHLGRLHPWKGTEELLETFARIHAQFRNAVLVLAGVDEGDFEAQWRTRARSGGFDHRLHFPGVVTGADREALLWRADIFCLPSRGEGLSMAMLEALAHSTAIMVSPGCNFPEAEKAGAGVIVPKDVEAMRRALSDLLADPDRVKAMAAAGRRLVTQRYSWDVVTDRLIDVYARGQKAAVTAAASRVPSSAGSR